MIAAGAVHVLNLYTDAIRTVANLEAVSVMNGLIVGAVAAAVSEAIDDTHFGR